MGYTRCEVILENIFFGRCFFEKYINNLLPSKLFIQSRHKLWWGTQVAEGAGLLIL
jgi:hypothetical protein